MLHLNIVLSIAIRYAHANVRQQKKVSLPNRETSQFLTFTKIGPPPPIDMFFQTVFMSFSTGKYRTAIKEDKSWTIIIIIHI